jgi:protein-histidine N-methyltransferase
MLSQLPSKIAFGFLNVQLDDGTVLRLPRRELWDVRVQLMAEDDGSGGTTEGLGKHDVKTGVYEGGFKSWESSVDMVKVLARRVLPIPEDCGAIRMIEVRAESFHASP